MDLDAYLRDRRERIEQALQACLPPAGTAPARLHESMRYSVFAGGKRIRPVLCIAAIEAVGGEPGPFLPAACALELVHTYSLIHDDLPAMDDDDMRRGRPTNHKVFGEATAILAGDALLTLSFDLIARLNAAPPPVRLELVRVLAEAGGAAGMVGGQALDIAAEGREAQAEMIASIHARKTAALIEASAAFGAILAGATAAQRSALSLYGRKIGMAFQITDDILDATGDEMKMGKRGRRDREAGKATYPAFYGVEESRRIAAEYLRSAREAIISFDDRAAALREIARRIADREK